MLELLLRLAAGAAAAHLIAVSPQSTEAPRLLLWLLLLWWLWPPWRRRDSALLRR